MVKKVYKSMQGKVVDMDALRARNETMPAIGNAKMNARGDEMGPGGKIIRKREESVAAYYENNPNARGPVADTPIINAPAIVAPISSVPVDSEVTTLTQGKKK